MREVKNRPLTWHDFFFFNQTLSIIYYSKIIYNIDIHLNVNGENFICYFQGKKYILSFNIFSYNKLTKQIKYKSIYVHKLKTSTQPKYTNSQNNANSHLKPPNPTQLRHQSSPYHSRCKQSQSPAIEQQISNQSSPSKEAIQLNNP